MVKKPSKKVAYAACSGGCRATADCIYGCVGCGVCVSVCPFEAIEINDLGVAEVNGEKCLGCGKCTFLAKLAHREKDVNFIGIDISEDILGVARRNIEAEFGEEPVENVNLLSYNIEKLDTLFSPDEKAVRIYVNFCNPWQKAGDHKRRLTHTRQLNTYKKVLAPGGELWFKTDNTDLYLATQRYLAEAGFEILCKTDDLHSEDAPGNIQSEHEVMFTAEGIKTKAIIARWNGEPETPERVSTEQAEKVENTAE